jgi:hypothetical protein
LGIEQNKGASRDLIADLRASQSFRETLPILILIFVPITFAYAETLGPTLSVEFLWASFEYIPQSMYPFQVSLFIPAVYLILSVPAFIASVVSAWALRRLAQKRTTSRNALRIIVGVTLVWAAYLLIFFFGSLSMGHFVVGPFPLPFGPIIAALSRKYIVRANEQIDDLERAKEGKVGQ